MTTPASTLRRTTFASALAAPVSATTWRRTAHLVLDLPVATAILASTAAALSFAFGLLPVVLGLPVLAATVTAAQYAARFEAARLRLFLGADVRRSTAARLGWGLRDQLRRCADRRSWRAIAYSVVALPLATVNFTAVVTGWSFAIAAATSPFWAPFVEDGGSHLGALQLATPAGIILTTVAGLAVAYLMPAVVRLLAAVDIRLARALLHGEHRS